MLKKLKQQKSLTDWALSSIRSTVLPIRAINSHTILVKKTNNNHGLVVMGGDSNSKRREFDSRYCKLDEHFFTYLFIVKFVRSL